MLWPRYPGQSFIRSVNQPKFGLDQFFSRIVGGSKECFNSQFDQDAGNMMRSVVSAQVDVKCLARTTLTYRIYDGLTYDQPYSALLQGSTQQIYGSSPPESLRARGTLLCRDKGSTRPSVYCLLPRPHLMSIHPSLYGCMANINDPTPAYYEPKVAAHLSICDLYNLPLYDNSGIDICHQKLCEGPRGPSLLVARGAANRHSR